MKRSFLGEILWCLLFVGVTVLFIVPGTRAAILSVHPYIAAFVKFALLASMGELLAARIHMKRWPKLTGATLAKAAVWGCFGIAIALMFDLFWAGTQGAADKGLLWMPNAFLHAFWTSALMNLTFGIVFMGTHRVTDGWIDARFSGKPRKLKEVVLSTDWAGFLGFTVGRTIPLFWIPAHTATFLLPGELRVLVAAYLSIALGILLSMGAARKGTARK